MNRLALVTAGTAVLAAYLLGLRVGAQGARARARREQRRAAPAHGSLEERLLGELGLEEAEQ
jgi:hypothetical protein